MTAPWRNDRVAIDTEDKAKWCEEGRRLEDEFVRLMSEHSHLSIKINPAKDDDPKVPDLMVPGYGACDLKSIRTPFFTADKYGVDPNDAITLNAKDVIRYRSMYPGLGIFFWVQWDTLSISLKRSKPVTYKWAVYFAELQDILALVDSGIAKSHAYQRRNTKGQDGPKRLQRIGMDESKNAISSYVIDSKWLEPILFSRENPWK